MSSTQYVDVERQLNNLEGELHPANIEAIHDFINHQAAEGISEVQQERQIQSFKTLLKKFAPEGFRLRGASERELKELMARMNRSDYADATKHKFKGTVKKFYKVENGGDHPDKVDFFKVTRKEDTPVSREDLFTEDELKRLFRSFSSTRDRALTMVLYESGARPGEVLNLQIADFISNAKGDFISIEGLKNTPNRTNQLVRAGRVVREWLVQHPLGGELGEINDPSSPLWVKSEQQECRHCGTIPRHHNENNCDYEPDLADSVNYKGFYRRFKQACAEADIPESKRRPYNLRHTRLTEVATFMGYEQLNKFAGWKPGSDRAKVYVHLNNDDVNSAIRDEYGLETNTEEEVEQACPFCGTNNQSQHSECRNCGRPLGIEQKATQDNRQKVLERVAELEEKGVLDKLLDELGAA